MDLPGSAMSESELWTTLDTAGAKTSSYRETLAELDAMPRGFGLCFAFNCVDADIANGGFSQLRRNSTWSLVLRAIDACELASASATQRVLRQGVQYFHEQGRSGLKRQLTDSFFEGLEHPVRSSLAELDDAHFEALEERRTVIHRLIAFPDLWVQGTWRSGIKLPFNTLPKV